MTYSSAAASRRWRKRVFRSVSNLFFALVGVYGASVSGLLLVRLLFGERWGVIGMFDSFAHLLLIPALPLLVLCLLVRRRGSALVQVMPAVIYIVSYGTFFLPHLVQAAPNTPEITFLTYNLNKGNQSLDAVIRNIRDSDADVVAFQELNTEIAAGVQEKLKNQYPYVALHPDLTDGFAGVGLISRYPILADNYWLIGLGQQRAELDVNGVNVFVHNVHPPHPLGGLYYRGDGRANAITAALERISGDSGAVVLLGDFNMTDQTPDYQRVTDHFRDSYREVGMGMGFTFPDFNMLMGISYLPPLARIDYVFHSDAFQALEAHVLASSGGSDHRPLVARLEFTPAT